MPPEPTTRAGTVARPAIGVRLFYLDDCGVLFSEATQELHLLNTMAAVIWTLMEEGHGASGTAAALQEMYGLDEARARQFVSSALAEWQRHRLLDEPSAAATATIAPAKPLPRAGPAWREFVAAAERHYRLSSTRFVIRFSSEAQARVIHAILQHLAADPADDGVAIDIVAVDSRIEVYRDRELFGTCAKLEEVAPIVKSLVWQTAVREQRFFLDIHAGVVGNGAACILLPAAAGSGKSTLTAALVHAGFEYYSDEVALLDEAGFGVYPMPLAMCVKAPGVEALADRFPELRGLAVHRRGDGKDVIYLPPPPASLPTSSEPCRVAAIVFPRYEAGAALSFEALPKPEALKRLLKECLVVSTPLDGAKVGELVRWIERTPCYRLTYGSSDEAIEAVRSVLPGAPVAAS